MVYNTCEELEIKVRQLKDKLMSMIEDESSLSSDEIIKESEKLDKLIIQYYTENLK